MRQYFLALYCIENPLINKNITQWIGTSPGSFLMVIISDQISRIRNTWYTIINAIIGIGGQGCRSITSNLMKVKYKNTITAHISTKNP